MYLLFNRQKMTEGIFLKLVRPRLEFDSIELQFRHFRLDRSSYNSRK